MKRLRDRRLRRTRSSEINMAPLIDMVFILLIFFIVTTSFVKESGMSIQRPTARSAEARSQVQLLVELLPDGRLFMEGRATELRAVSPRMSRLAAESPDAAVVVVADRDSRTGQLIRVLDAIRSAGVEKVSVAARRPSK